MKIIHAVTHLIQMSRERQSKLARSSLAHRLISSGDCRPLRAPTLCPLCPLALTGTPPEPLSLGHNHYQLCSCDNAPLEDAFHVLFDCARHSDSARAALLRASARWCARANIPHDAEGRRTALHWAMTDQPPPSSPRIALRSPTACAELRQCIQHCYALSLSRRYNKTKGAASQHLANK